MKKRNRINTLVGCISFFLLIALIVTVAMLIYGTVEKFSNKTVALIMFGVIVALSALCTAVDFLRRRYTVDRPVNKILGATDRIAGGDFSIRLEPEHPISRYNEFDYIMENLNRMAAELSKNEVLKTDFISNVSHEIKTPLAVIQNYAAALKSEKLSAQDRLKYTQTLVDAAKRLTGLVTDILKLNKLENQRITPDRAAVRLDEQLAQTVFGFEDIIDEKGLTLNCDVDEVTAFTSPSYLEIVWNNLLSNAVKFTPAGGSVGISLKADKNNAVVKISDTGIGISPETGARIFDKFYQGDTSHANEGNGLGLALVKKVIDILGGDISVESGEGSGSTFTVVLKGVVGEEGQ